MAETVTQVQFLESHIAFLERDAKHKLEKPYKLQYDPGSNSEIPRTNTVSKHYGPITLHDFRVLEKPMIFEKNGFCVLDMESKLSPEDFYDEEKVRRIYYPELQALILEKFKATRVEILEHLVGRPPNSEREPEVSGSLIELNSDSKASRRVSYFYWRGL
jgi:hypothetical protein